MPNLTLNQFLDYIRAFNSRDYEKQHSYYASDVQLIIPDPAIGALHGSEGIKEHYAPIHAAATETVIPITVLVDRNKIFFEMEAYFQYFKATDRAVHGYKVEPGDVIKITSWALYDIDESGKMKRIVCNLFAQELIQGQGDVKGLIKDSESRADSDVRLYGY
jgi:hypothetical protein